MNVVQRSALTGAAQINTRENKTVNEVCFTGVIAQIIYRCKQGLTLQKNGLIKYLF